MKKLYRKGTVHPSPSSTTSNQFISLSFLPAAILTLAAALSAEEKEVLAYLLSCSTAATTTTPFDFDPSKSHKKHQNKNNNNNNNHATSLTCYCFTCYTTYWARWDSSPNRQLIHEIIDAFEDGLLPQRKKKQGANKRDKKKNHASIKSLEGGTNGGGEASEGSVRVNTELGRVGSVEEGGLQGQLIDEAGENKQGSVRKMVSFIGERIWGSVWG